MPVNSTLLKQVQEKLLDGEYHAEPHKLVDDLKKDPGLFIHGVRNLKSVMDDFVGGIDPLAILGELEEEKLKKIFSVSERQISSHRFRDMHKVQALRLQHSVISSQAAETMAARLQGSGDLAFSGSMMRQLGHDLIAWNYPDLYARALAAQRNKGMNLDLELVKYLGLAPLQIGAKFAADWNLNADLRMVVAPKRKGGPLAGVDRDGQSGQEAVFTLAQLCEMSEQFAQANDPEHYPHAAELWKASEAKLRQAAGGEILDGIYSGVVETLSLADDFVAKPLEPPFFTRPEVSDGLNDYSRELMRKNHYLDRCPEGIKKALAEVYQHLNDAKLSVAALRVLVDRAIPMAGFSRGCYYLLDRRTLLLNPSMRVGDKALSAYQAIAASENHPVVESLYASVPIRVVGVSEDGGPVMQLSGAVSTSKRLGVLYLELEEWTAHELGVDSFICFQAIRTCLIDCLGEPSAKK